MLLAAFVCAGCAVPVETMPNGVQSPDVLDQFQSNPLASPPVETPETGTPGGVLRLAIPREVYLENTLETMLREPVLSLDGPSLLVCEPDESNRVFTLTLNDICWSDGTQLSAADLMAGLAHTAAQDALWLHAAGLPDAPMATFAQVDAYTVILTFAQPYPLFPYILSDPYRHYVDVLLPSHANVDIEALRQGAAPSLSPWVRTDETTYERNPYYWKTDAAGTQLPYIDSLEITWVGSWQAALQAEQNGLADVYWERSVACYDALDATLPATHRRMVMNADASAIMLTFGQQGSAWARQHYDDKRFRGMLGLYIDRKQLSEQAQNGYGMDKRMQSKEYYNNPQIAQVLYDELGFGDANDGWLLWPDGTAFAMTLTYSDYAPGVEEAAQAVADSWRAMGFAVRLEKVTVGAHVQAGMLDLQLRPLPLPVRGIYTAALLDEAVAGWMDWRTVWDTPEGQTMDIAEEARKTWPQALQMGAVADLSGHQQAAQATVQGLIDAYCWFFILEGNDTLAWDASLHNVHAWARSAADAVMDAELFFWAD